MKVLKMLVLASAMLLIIVLLPLLITAAKIITRLKRQMVAGIPFVLYKTKAKAFVGTPVEVLRNMGGVFLAYQTKEQIRAAVRNKKAPLHMRIIALAASPGYSVCVVKDILPDLTKEELNALIAHEYGHIVHGHLTTQEEEEEGLVYKLEYELQADDYAASQTSATVLKSGLIKIRDMDISRFDKERLADINLRIDRLA
jgi:Zn-dependent protease with chaperone function